MAEEFRNALVTVGKETPVSEADENTVILAFDKSSNLMKPIPGGSTPKLISTDIIVTVGDGGDFISITLALEYLSKMRPTYKNVGVSATVKLLPNFVMREQVVVVGIDLSWITITGEDAKTTIDGTYITEYFRYHAPSAFYGFDGALPTINQNFYLDTTNNTSKVSFLTVHNARATLHEEVEIIGSRLDGEDFSTSFFGLLASACGSIDAERVIVRHFQRGLAAGGCGMIDFEGGEVSNCHLGVRAVWGSTINCDSVNGSVDNDTAFNVYGGGVITADNTDGSSYSQPVNVITSHGMIYFNNY